jgi:hypothetical protein
MQNTGETPSEYRIRSRSTTAAFHEDLRIGIEEALAGQGIPFKELLLELGVDPAELSELEDDSDQD